MQSALMPVLDCNIIKSMLVCPWFFNDASKTIYKTFSVVFISQGKCTTNQQCPIDYNIRFFVIFFLLIEHL